MKYVPELEEERFQSLLSVPIQGQERRRHRRHLRAHRGAARVLPGDEVDFVVTAASLVAGAIENARLYGEMQRRVHELEALTELAEAIARTEALEELLPAVADGARRLLDAEACHVYLIERGGDDLRLGARTRRGRPRGRPSRSPSSARSFDPRRAGAASPCPSSPTTSCSG